MTATPRPRLRWTDAWLLTAIASAELRDGPVNLAEMIAEADSLQHAVPLFDHVSFGLQRLVAAGLVTVEHPPQGGLLLRAAKVPLEVVRASDREYRRRRRLGLHVGSLGESVDPMYAAIQATDEEPEDRSAGRLPGFAPADLERAVAAYHEWFRSLFDRSAGTGER